MRVATEDRVVQAEPGTTVELVVDVVNTSDLIDGITAQLIGLPDATVVVEPQLLPLFPGAQGQIRLTIEVPATQPAGSHPLTVEVVSHGAGSVSQHVDVDLSVSARPAVRLGRTPHTVRGRRTGRFVLDVENTGNTALDVALDAAIEDSRTTARFTPRTLRVEPGITAPAILVLRGPRMFTGAEIDRTAAINLTARRTNVISAMQEAEQEPELAASTTVVLRQRPTVSRGVLTALVLMLIIGLWAAVFLLGLTQVLSGDPLTKTAPASFFPVSAESGAAEGDSAAGGAGGGAAGGDAAAAAPAGAMPKDGLLPPGVGGTITGTVSATSNELPVGRILVEAYRDGRDGMIAKPISSAATETDGSYELPGLYPTSYRLKFSAKGFDPIWYPARNAPRRATQVAVTPQKKVEGINAVVTGQPASISGSVDPGSSLTPVEAVVTARPLDILTPEGLPAGVVARTTTTAGAYTLTDLPAPATYELAFQFEGYAVKKVVTAVSGGERRLQPSVVPTAAAGTIAGTVTDGTGNALGGVTVSTTVAGEDIAIVTPTVGTVGAFTLGNLPTPGTYVLTFTAEGRGSTSQVIELSAGQNRPGLAVDLVAGTGSVTGRLLGPDGEGLGGATVTVGGATSIPTAADGAGEATALVPTATTLTTGPPSSIGTFSISGLAAPGEYTVTFTLEGYTSQSVPIELGASGPGQTVDVTLTNELGTLSGIVQNGSTPYAGATITVTDGQRIWTATSGDQGNGDLKSGGYRIDGLPPGSYAATVTAPGMRQQTALVTIVAGVETKQGLRVRKAS
ncbi:MULTISPECIES: carboxypeptidase-like regulatory domain-containing protein [unclassified Nocardioides]|uniref:carboxypeptidase-like regulatory domain-containing protein n=1 Tax=unclassified Nocardioides TaxID=2615069 RepID=UPI003014FF60